MSDFHFRTGLLTHKHIDNQFPLEFRSPNRSVKSLVFQGSLAVAS